MQTDAVLVHLMGWNIGYAEGKGKVGEEMRERGEGNV